MNHLRLFLGTLTIAAACILLVLIWNSAAQGAPCPLRPHSNRCARTMPGRYLCLPLYAPQVCYFVERKR